MGIFYQRAALIGAGVFILAMAMKNDMQRRVFNALGNSNVRAFLDMIARFESNGSYTVIYGGQHFDTFAAHPNVRVPFFNPATGKNDYSTAAGRYQINMPTYRWVAPLLNISDFSPDSQDAIAVGLLYLKGALGDVEAGDFDTAIRKASGTWASLPMSMSGQHKVGYDTALNEYLKHGGTVA